MSHGQNLSHFFRSYGQTVRIDPGIVTVFERADWIAYGFESRIPEFFTEKVQYCFLWNLYRTNQITFVYSPNGSKSQGREFPDSAPNLARDCSPKPYAPVVRRHSTARRRALRDAPDFAAWLHTASIDAVEA